MSLHPSLIEPVPEQTAQIAHAAFPKGSPYLTLRDELGTLYRDDDFSTLFPASGQSAFPPWRLALVTILQFRESLSDRQAAEAVRGRIDWTSGSICAENYGYNLNSSIINKIQPHYSHTKQ